MNEKEVWVYFLAYNLIRLLMCEAAMQACLVPREISFKHTVQVWTAWSRQAWNTAEPDPALLFILIAQQQVGNRSGRVEPRAVKKRPKACPRLKIPRAQAREKVKK